LYKGMGSRPPIALSIAVLCVSLALCSPAAQAQDGAILFKNYCASCHEAGTNGDSRAPSREVLAQLTPEQILQALEKGAMKAQAAERSRPQRRALAEYLSGKPLGSEASSAIPKSAFCAASAPLPRNALQGPAWNGWGVTITNSRFEPAEAAGIPADEVPRLKLKWAFGFPGASSGGTQPVVVGGHVYVGDAEGDLFALDAQTGCIRWTIEVEAGIRSALSIGESGGRLLAYFGDQSANVYAVEAESGKLVWKVKVDDYSRAAVTGAPQLYAGRLYVPVSSREESQVGDPKYPCCAFRGSVVALDASTGRKIWKTYTIAEEARPTQKNAAGTQIVGPSGAAVWNAPTLDVKRSTLYVGTGNNFSPPSTKMSDSIVALDMKTGKIKWFRQETENDIWNASCRRPDREPAVCPDADSPDFDFGSSPVLAELPGGRQILVAGNKSGIIWALDPDRQGKIVWQQQVGKGTSGGGVLWGIAVNSEKDNERVYVPNGFFDPKDRDASGGMAAIALKDGHAIWSTPNPPCGDRKTCKPSHPAAVTAIPGVVFSGTMDGRLRAYAAQDGKVLWEYDTARDFSTVNGVKANGGSMSNAGPSVVGGMLFVNSGYSHHGGIIPGNALLAFSPEKMSSALPSSE
jgi:polyvinyl alcohol dehydrogenase (cytochrome)